MKKKLLLITLMVAALACMLVMSASAATYVDENGIKYVTNSDGTAYVADNRSAFSATEAIIAEKITVDGAEYTVTSVANDVFYGETQLVTVYFPPTITKLSGYTLSSCSALENIYINFENLVVVGERGLTTCNNSNGDSGTKKTINFYDPSEYGKENPKTVETANFKNITTIGAAAMQGLNVKHLILGENLSSMSKQCFRHATIETLEMKTTKLTTFYHYAFNACLNLKTIVIKSAPTKIENDYFSQCSAVESITIDLSKCTEVGGSAFEFSTGCQGSGSNSKTVWYNLEGKNIVDLSSLRVINSEAFGTSNIGMASIIWPTGLTSLSDQAFRKANITGTMYINAAEGKTISMPYWAFNGNAPTTVIIGPGVTKVECRFEAQCTVVCLADSVSFTDGTVFSKSGSVLYYKSKTGATTSNVEAIQITGGTVSNYGSCGVTAEVVTEGGNVIIGTTTHSFVIGEYDNTVCPIDTFKTHTCSKCNGTKFVSDIEGLTPKAHDHSVAFNITYADYTASGIYTYKCVGCTSTVTEDEANAPALITYSGYATKDGEGSICIGYSVNTEAIEAYKQFNEEFKYGVIAYVPSEGETDLKLINDAYELTNPQYTIFAELDGSAPSFEFVIRGFGEEYLDLELAMCAYVYDGTKASYLNIDQATNKAVQSDAATTITYNGFVA